MSAELEREFVAGLPRLPGTPAAQRRRRDALAAFAAQGFPTRRNEAWHYTDLKPIATGGFEYAPREGTLAAPRREALQHLLAGAAPGYTGPRAVFVDGRLEPALCRLDGGHGLSIGRLAEDPERFAAVLERRAVLEAHPLAELNAAFAPDGLAIETRRGAPPAELHVYFAGGAAGRSAAQPRVAIELAPQTLLRLVVHCLEAPGGPAEAGAEGASGWLNVVTQAALAEGSRLAVYRLQEQGDAYFETLLLAAELAKDASLEVGYVDLGGRLVRNDIDVRLLEPGAHASLFGVFVAGTGRHVDNHTKIEHVAPYTTSDEAFRGIADRDGHGVFNGKVVVHHGAHGIDARQASDNLLLAERAEIDTKPELEIYADDVECSHGATVGELDAEQLFYLRSRGIAAEAARALLTFAFAATLLERLEPASLRARAVLKVAGQLPGGAPEEIAI